MTRARAVLVLVALVLPGPAGASSVDGIWGVAKGDGANCAGIAMVLRDGTYTKAMLDLGTTKGLRDSIVGTSTFSVSGDRVEIAPSFSLSRPEPRQIYLWDPVGQVLIREQPTPRLTYRRCPDRPLRPIER